MVGCYASGMKIVYPVAAFLVFLFASPAFSEEQAANSASAQRFEGKSVGTIRGQAGIVILDGEIVELKDRVVYVNGQSFGTVPKACEIRFVVSGTGHTLYVDGKPRHRSRKE